MTLTELAKLDPADFLPGELRAAATVLAAFEETGIVLVTWKRASRGKGSTSVCTVKEVRPVGKRILLRLRTLTSVPQKTITTYASSIAQSRPFSREEIRNLTSGRVNSGRGESVLSSEEDDGSQ